MGEIKLYYATNRKHEGDRWHPKSYGKSFSDDGMENLRFGKITRTVNESAIAKYLSAGDGEGLSRDLTKYAKSPNIVAYKEDIPLKDVPDIHQPEAKLGSVEMFNDLKEEMMQHTDVLIFIHGFNVSWSSAVDSAMALQFMLNRPGIGDNEQKILVILFTWPSDGLALPYASYKSDRSEAKGSGYAFGRGILKLRDFLMRLNTEAKTKKIPLCGQNIHLLCHSMGNYVLQNALARIIQFTTGGVLPKIFEHIFLCAPDVDDNVLENGQPMERIHELCQYVNIYYNRQDVALKISNYTKGHPERLGSAGAAHPSLLHNKIHQIDCSPIVHGPIEHSYYLWGPINEDIRLSIDDVAFDDPKRKRKRDSNLPNSWVMVKES